MAAGSSLVPRATILSVPSGSGRCSFKASSAGAVIQASTSSGVVRITGIAFGYFLGAALMIAGGIVAIFLGVKAEGQSLESIAKPLTAEDDAQTPDAKAAV